MALKILQFGRTGQVGLELLRLAIARGHQVTALGRDTVDLADPNRVPWAISAAGPVDIVINGAAYTAVDRAESEPEIAHAVNAEAVGVLAETCGRRNLPVIQLSTDYVFSGEGIAPYKEDDPTGPLNIYGRTKLAGEEQLRQNQPHHVIVRTSWVYGALGSNFVKSMLRLGAERAELKIVDDQFGAPTAAVDIADACLRIAEQVVAEPNKAPWGTYHFTGRGETTWRRFAEAIFELAAPWNGAGPHILPIPTSAYPTPAVRPLNSRLDCTKILTTFGIETRDWRDSLAEVLAEIRSAKEAELQ